MTAWGGVAQGAGSLLGSVATGLISMNQAKKQRKANMRLAEYSYSKDLEMWNRQNEYNDPTSQMKRLKDAGLNPNLVYGNSSVSGNTSTQIPKYQRPEVPRGTMTLEMPHILGALNQYQDYMNKGVQHDNLGKQTELMSKESDIKSLTQLKILASTAKTTAERNKINTLIDSQLKLLNNQAQNERYKMNISGKDWQNYSKYGIRPTDSILYRGAATLKDKFSDWFNSKMKDNYRKPRKIKNPFWRD